MSYKNIYYSDKYYDDKYEYRWVVNENLLNARYLASIASGTCFFSFFVEWRPINVFECQVELMHTFSFVFLLFWQACSTAKRFGQTSAQESFDDRSRVEGSWRPTKSRLDSLHDPPARYCWFHFRVLYVMTVYLIFLQSLTSCCFDAPSPHPQWKKRNHKKIGLATRPPESHQVRLKCVAIDNYSIWRFLFDSSSHSLSSVQPFPTHSLHT